MSGKSLGGREQLRVLLDFIGKGDVLVVTKLDRLGRNLLDILVVIQEIEAKGAQLVSIGERFDTTSPMGVAMFQVAGVFAQLERAMIRLRHALSRHQLPSQGFASRVGAIARLELGLGLLQMAADRFFANTKFLRNLRGLPAHRR